MFNRYLLEPVFCSLIAFGKFVANTSKNGKISFYFFTSGCALLLIIYEALDDDTIITII